MSRACLWAAFGLIIVSCATPCRAQGILSDLMSGKLIAPRVGVYAWYTLTDRATGKKFFLRQAVVGDEKVKRKDGYWLETELVPEVGFPSIYKMLLTGPASNPENVHRLLVREGNGAIQEVDVTAVEKAETRSEPREAVGVETLTLPAGEIEAEHYVVEEEGTKTELWISETIPPMGLVKMVNGEGELVLQRFGEGGKDGQSALPDVVSQGGDVTGMDGAPAGGEAAGAGGKGKDRKSNITVRRRQR